MHRRCGALARRATGACRQHALKLFMAANCVYQYPAVCVCVCFVCVCFACVCSQNNIHSALSNDPCSSSTRNSCRGPSSRCVSRPQTTLGYTCECMDRRYQLQNNECVDINECNRVPAVCIGAGSECENLSPGYRCARCGEGYKASSDRQSCIATAAACTPNPCSGGVCVPLQGDKYRCECPAGSIAVNDKCEDVGSLGNKQNEICAGRDCKGVHARCVPSSVAVEGEVCVCDTGSAIACASQCSRNSSSHFAAFFQSSHCCLTKWQFFLTFALFA